MEGESVAPLETFIQIDRAIGGGAFKRNRDERRMSPEVASLLKAVLLAVAEQVSREKLRALKVDVATDLSLLGLAMAFNSGDTGVVGDFFEWSVLIGVNSGHPELSQLFADALKLNGLTVDRPQAVLVAAEGGRLVDYSPQVSSSATISTGKRGRPPVVANILATANPKDWKADLLIGEGDKWVTASLKSSPRSLVPSLEAAAGTPLPPRIGVTATSARGAGVRTDPRTGATIVQIPVSTSYFSLAKLVIGDVIAAFSRHLSLPSTPLLRDATGIGAQLHFWRERSIDDVVEALTQLSEGWLNPLTPPKFTGTNAADASSALIVANTLMPNGGYHGEYEDFLLNEARHLARYRFEARP